MPWLTPSKAFLNRETVGVPGARRRPGQVTSALFAPAERALLPRQATLAAQQVHRCRRRRAGCAEVVAPYPPGIPAAIPGEVIDSEHLDVIDTALSRRFLGPGGRVQRRPGGHSC